MADLIDRAKLIGALEDLKQGWAVADDVLDAAIEVVKAQPPGNVKPSTFLDWRAEATAKEQRRRTATLHLIEERSESGLLEE